MRKRLVVLGVTILTALAVAAPSYGAYTDPVLEQASLTVVKHGRKPSWKLDYLLCYTGPGTVQVSVSEYQYLQGAKFRTLTIQTRGRKNLQDPSERGAGGSCSTYHSETYRSFFGQRAGYANGVTLQIVASNAPGRTITRNFRLHP